MKMQGRVMLRIKCVDLPKNDHKISKKMRCDDEFFYKSPTAGFHTASSINKMCSVTVSFTMPTFSLLSSSARSKKESRSWLGRAAVISERKVLRLTGNGGFN